jgi:hypothetical protein
MAPLCALAGLVLTQPFQLEASVEAETRGGRLATGEDDQGLGAEFSVEPMVRGTYVVERARIEASYEPRFFTRARGLGGEEILLLHRASFMGAFTLDRRLQLTFDLDGADGQVDFSNATLALDVGDVDEAALAAVPDQPVIEYTRGRAGVGLRWLPARLWTLESNVSATVYRGRENPAYPLGSTPALRDQLRCTWHNRVDRQTDRDTTWGGILELSYRDFGAGPTFAGVTATGILAQRLGQHTRAELRLGAHGAMRESDGPWVGQPGLPVGRVVMEHVMPVAPNRRLGLEARIELQPFFDSVFGTLDSRLVVGLENRLVLSDELSVLGTAEWANLLHLWDEGRAGQAEHVIDASVRFAYRPSSLLGIQVGIRYASRLHKEEIPGPLTSNREELVAFVAATLSSELLGD